jgi:heat shock protein HtpX
VTFAALLPASFSLCPVITLAVTPALAAWWTGRALLTRVDDPVLPELLFERRRRLAGFGLGGAVAIAILFADDALWAIPLLWLALLVSAYPLRRTLFGEQWGALAYLRYAVSSAIGHVGVWIVAGCAPAIVTSLAVGLEPYDTNAAVRVALWTGIAFAIVIVVWQHNYARIFLALHRAEPLRASRPELMAKLDAILERAGATLPRRPETYRYGAPGGYVMNAFAIPSLSHPAVALGDTLLATMDDDEIAGVFAHEIAHHEQFTRAKLWRAWCAGVVLAALTAVLPVVLLRTLPTAAALATWCVPLLVIITLGKRAARRRDAETASDLRATVLTGDPAALARALTKLHVYSRVPRRWPHAIERAATHPSLARRIQALRERGGTLEPHVPEVNVICRATTSDTVVALDGERVYWLEGVPSEAPLVLDALRAAASSYRAMAYRDLAELRVGADSAGRAIIATDLAGHSWSAPISPNDVATLQAALDKVDLKLGHRRAAAAPASAPAVRWLALALLVTLTMAGELGLALIPLIVVLARPALTAAVAAAAAIALGRLLLAVRAIGWADPVRQLAALAAACVAVTLIVLAARRARVDASRGAGRRVTREAWLITGVLAAMAGLMALGVAPTAMKRPTSLIGSPLAISAAVTFLGLGAALLTLPQAWCRAGGILASCVALAGGAFFSKDQWPFGGTRSIVWTNATLIPAGSVAIPAGALTVTASPNGSAFAVSQYHASRGRSAPVEPYIIGRFGDPTHAVRKSNAVKIAFVDDEMLLALEPRGTDSLELRTESVAPDATGNVAVPWRERFKFFDAAQLIVDRAHRSWLLIGRDDGDEGPFIIVADSIGGLSPKVRRFTPNTAERETGDALTQLVTALPDMSAIWLTFPQFRSRAGAAIPMLITMTGSIRWELHSSGPAGEQFLADLEGYPTCGTDVGSGGVLCVDRLPNATRLWRVASPGTIERIADLPPALDLVHIASVDRMSAAERFGPRLILVDAIHRRGARLTVPGESQRTGNRWTTDLTAQGEYVFVLIQSRDGAVLSRYRVRN